MKEYIKQKLLSYADNEYMRKYIELCDFYIENPSKTRLYQFHHVFPAFLYRLEKQAKNRSKIIDDLDKDYIPEDNVVKISPKFHLIIHYFLGMALKTKEAINSFQIFLGDYYTPITDYNLEQIKELGQMYQDTCQPNRFDKYLTQSEKEKYYKEFLKNKIK